jgi:hypothetical protein
MQLLEALAGQFNPAIIEQLLQQAGELGSSSLDTIRQLSPALLTKAGAIWLSSYDAASELTVEHWDIALLLLSLSGIALFRKESANREYSVQDASRSEIQRGERCSRAASEATEERGRAFSLPGSFERLKVSLAPLRNLVAAPAAVAQVHARH